MRLVAFLVAAASLVVACSSGPQAPTPGPTQTACTQGFCISYPGDWEVEVGDTYLSFHHPSAPDSVEASVSDMNMEGVVEGAGDTWPVPNDQVVRDLWSQLEDAGLAKMDTIQDVPGLGVRSSGSYDGGRLWHLMVPIDAVHAVGVEVRAPNASWAPHAEVFLTSLHITP